MSRSYYVKHLNLEKETLIWILIIPKEEKTLQRRCYRGREEENCEVMGQAQ